MFTGIIQSVGAVQAVAANAGKDWRLTLSVGKLEMNDVSLGDSIAVNGVCLTVTALTDQSFSADVSNETLTVSAFKALKVGDAVNLEKALRLSDRLGGHMVSGHVDAVAKVLHISMDGASWRYRFSLPEAIARYVAQKGSITINGVSLTVNEVEQGEFGVNIVPHTLVETNLGQLKLGDVVNLEVDLIARYLERIWLGTSAQTSASKLTPDFLAEHGFMH